MPEAERVKPRSLYVEEAIQLALESKWEEALAVNTALVERHGPDEDTYNRIGKAQSELGNLQAALESYAKALELNPLNLIAQKNTRKIATLLETAQPVAAPTKAGIDVDLFTEEPGKSALTVLVPPKKGVTVAVAPGDVVELDVADGRLEARTSRGVLLGDVDVKLARRLTPLMETGNRYTAAVARVADERIEIMVREEFQSAANAGTPSFPITRAHGAEFRPYAKESLLAQRGIDAEGLDAADPDEEETEYEEADDAGMQTTEDFDDESAVLPAEEDEGDSGADDDEGRPEDQY